ncbi:MAG: hypothetical protein J5869_00980 [Bacteroidaceae bacterium]|nr:hypothetical protein [Bacteroidaceae bacterium]
MKKYHLLDHKWQKVGFVMFAVCVLLCLVFWQAILYDLLPHVLSKNTQDPAGSGWASALVLLLTPISFALMALSQEKQEDERIVEIRHQALVTIVIIYVVWSLLMFLTTPFLVRLVSPSTLGKINMILRIPTGVSAFMGYYVLIFKLSLWRQNRELSDEE